jgi:hypothetical protein
MVIPRLNNKAMKIVVEQKKEKGKNTYIINVMEGNSIVKTETAKSIKERDTLVFQLAESYNIDDIILKEPNKQRVKKKNNDPKLSEIPSIPVLTEEEAEEFFEENNELLYNRILQAIQEGLDFNRNTIRLFELAGTGVYMTSRRDDWVSGLVDAIAWYTQDGEQYEKCAIAKSLIDRLDAERDSR